MSLFRSDTPTSSHKISKEVTQGEFLWQGTCRQIKIKDFLPVQASFCEYTWEIFAGMVITSEGQVGPDIWPETPNQSTSTEDMIIMT